MDLKFYSIRYLIGKFEVVKFISDKNTFKEVANGISIGESILDGSFIELFEKITTDENLIETKTIISTELNGKKIQMVHLNKLQGGLELFTTSQESKEKLVLQTISKDEITQEYENETTYRRTYSASEGGYTVLIETSKDRCVSWSSDSYLVYNRINPIESEKERNSINNQNQF